METDSSDMQASNRLFLPFRAQKWVNDQRLNHL